MDVDRQALQATLHDIAINRPKITIVPAHDECVTQKLSCFPEFAG